MGYKLITPMDAASSMVVVQAKDLKAVQAKLKKAECPSDNGGRKSRPHFARVL
jgi:hypothetical protein